MVLDKKSSQEYPANAGVPQGSILVPTLFLLYINHLPGVICNTAIYADDTIFYYKCDQASNLWQQLELVDFNAGKTQLVLFDWSNNAGAINVKMDQVCS